MSVCTDIDSKKEKHLSSGFFLAVFWLNYSWCQYNTGISNIKASKLSIFKLVTVKSQILLSTSFLDSRGLHLRYNNLVLYKVKSTAMIRIQILLLLCVCFKLNNSGSILRQSRNKLFQSRNIHFGGPNKIEWTKNDINCMTVLVAKVKCKLNFYVKINKEKKELKMIGPILYQIL